MPSGSRRARPEDGGRMSLYDPLNIHLIVTYERVTIDRSAKVALRCFENPTPVYQEERKEILEWQRPYEQDEEEVMGKLLFTANNIHKVKRQLHEMWRKREKKLKEIIEIIEKRKKNRARHEEKVRRKGSTVAKAILPEQQQDGPEQWRFCKQWWCAGGDACVPTCLHKHIRIYKQR